MNGTDHPRDPEPPSSDYSNSSPNISPRLKHLRGMFILLGLVLALCLALKDRGPAIDPNSPAAQLQRDDAAKQAKAEADLEAAKAGTTQAKELKRFLKFSGEQEIREAQGLWLVKLSLAMDYDRCREYYFGSSGPCRDEWKGMELDKESLRTDPPLSVDWKTHVSSYWLEGYASFVLPLEDLPDNQTLRVTIGDLPKEMELDKKTVEIPVPQFTVTPRLSRVFADPDNPDRLLVQGSVTSSLPMDRESLLSRLRITLEAKGGRISAPEFFWKNDRACTFTLAVEELPAEPGPLALTLDKGVARAKGKASTDKAQRVSVLMPSRDSLVAVDSLELTAVAGDDDVVRPLIVAGFTVPVKTGEALSAVTARLLPLYATAEAEREGKATDWQTWQTIPADIMAKSTPVALAPTPQRTEYTEQVSFGYKAPAGHFLALEVKGGLHGRSGYVMGNPWRIVQQVPALEKKLRFMQEGHILGLNGARKLALYSRGLDTIRWKAWRVKPEFLNLLVNKSSYFADPRISGYSIEMEEISDVLEGNIPLGDNDGISPQYSGLDLGALVEKGARGIFQLSLEGFERSSSKVEESRFILLTDLGLIVKKDSKGGRAVFVSAFSTGKPVAGAEVRVIGRNGAALFTTKTDAAGRADVPDVSGFSAEKEPVALDVRHAGDMTYLPLRDHNVVFQPPGISKHAHDPDDDSEKPSGPNLLIFSERGIFRPGETLRFGLLAKDQQWDPKAVAGLPLTVRIYDPLDMEIKKEVVTLSPEGLGEITLGTGENDHTGTYTLTAYLGNAQLGSAEVQVEDFQPDRIKARSRLLGKEASAPAAKGGWLRPEDVTAEVRAENLYGFPARGHTVRARYQASKAGGNFLSYKDYTFVSPARADARSGSKDTLSEVETDDEGLARYRLPLESLEDATYNLYFTAEVFEPGGGRSVMSTAHVLVSPYSQLLGWRSNANLNFLAKDAPAELELIALGSDGAPVDSEPLTLKIRVVDNNSVLVKNDAGQYRYEQQRRTRVVENRSLVIGKDGLKLSLPTGETGEHELVLEDAGGAARCALNFTVAGGADRYQGLKRDATLRIRLDKTLYKDGEDIQVFISAPYAGSGLITLESDRVLAHTWFTSTTTDSVQRIRVPADLEGRGFLLVHMLRDQASESIHMDPMTMAFESFLTSPTRRNMALSLQTPELVVPGEPLTIGVSAQKPGKALVFAVDEGILQLTGYETPSPILEFLANTPYNVTSMRNWNLLMAEYGLVQRASAFGGDLNSEASSRLNPFKRKAEGSVVYWSGLVDVGPKRKDLTWTVPAHFNGRLRVMAVGASAEALGEADSVVFARAPVIITPNLPVAAAPGDSFDVTVALANNVKGSGKAAPIALNVELDQGLAFESDPPKTVMVDEGREGRATFRLKATDALGESVVRFSASMGQGKDAQTVRRPISLSVRPATPRMTAFAAGRLKEDQQAIPVARELYSQFSTVDASLSALPLPLVQGLARFLTEFPHGCTEQILSKAFPYALLHAHKDLLPLPAGKTAREAAVEAQAAVDAAVLALRSRKVGAGRYALWPQSDNSYDYLSVYALDFLLAAKQAGFTVPGELLEDAGAAMRGLLEQLPQNLNAARVQAYAAWVYNRSRLLGTSGEAKDISGLIKHYDQALPGWRKDVTAALLAGSYTMLRQQKEAETLIKDVEIAGSDAKSAWRGDNWFINPLWANGLYLTILAEHFPDRLRSSSAQALLIGLVNDIAASRYTTTGAVQAARGIVGYAAAVSAQAGQNAQNAGKALSVTARDGAHVPLPPEAARTSGDLVKRVRTDHRAAEFLFSGGKDLYWQISSSGFDRVLAPGPVARKILLGVEYMPVNGKPLSDLAQGDEVNVVVRAKALEEPLDNVAITALLPGGFEMVIAQGGQVVGSKAEAKSSDDESENKARAHASGVLMEDARQALAQAGVSASPMLLAHAERREERMILYASLDKQERVFVFRIKAVNKGSFSLPAAFAEALYDPDARARTDVGKVEVK